jgi:anti-sigma factor RsiW
MSNELKDILSNSSKDIDNQQLMGYLSKQLKEDSLHEVEKAMADDPFMNDAVEGLQQIESTKRMEAYAELLNKDLHKQIAKSKKKKSKRRWKGQPYTYLTIVIILLLLVICFLVLKKRLDPKPVSISTVVSQNISIKK